MGRRSYWMDPPCTPSWSVVAGGRAPGVFRRKLPIRYDGKSNQGDSAGPQAPDYVYVWRQLSAEIRFLARCEEDRVLSLSPQLIAIDQHDDGGKETFTIENIPN